MTGGREVMILPYPEDSCKLDDSLALLHLQKTSTRMSTARGMMIDTLMPARKKAPKTVATRLMFHNEWTDPPTKTNSVSPSKKLASRTSASRHSLHSSDCR